jgi:hypothetical protein
MLEAGMLDELDEVSNNGTTSSLRRKNQNNKQMTHATRNNIPS